MITYCPRCGASYHAEFRGTDADSGRLSSCGDCGLTVSDPPAMLARGNTEDEAEYDLGEWEMAERGAASSALLEAEIPFRWEASLVLVVPAVAEEEVDVLLDELDEVAPTEDSGAGTEDSGADGGEEAHRAMADLFVAADRLQHDPADASLAAEVMGAASTVQVSLPPYGIQRPVWRRIQDLASTVVADLEDGGDEDTVAAGARALREYLRDLV